MSHRTTSSSLTLASQAALPPPGWSGPMPPRQRSSHPTHPSMSQGPLWMGAMDGSVPLPTEDPLAQGMPNTLSENAHPHPPPNLISYPSTTPLPQGPGNDPWSHINLPMPPFPPFPGWVDMGSQGTLHSVTTGPSSCDPALTAPSSSSSLQAPLVLPVLPNDPDNPITRRGPEGLPWILNAGASSSSPPPSSQGRVSPSASLSTWTRSPRVFLMGFESSGRKGLLQDGFGRFGAIMTQIGDPNTDLILVDGPWMIRENVEWKDLTRLLQGGRSSPSSCHIVLLLPSHPSDPSLDPHLAPLTRLPASGCERFPESSGQHQHLLTHYCSHLLYSSIGSPAPFTPSSSSSGIPPLGGGHRSIPSSHGPFISPSTSMEATGSIGAGGASLSMPSHPSFSTPTPTPHPPVITSTIPRTRSSKRPRSQAQEGVQTTPYGF
ncbi:hypothetical protein BJ684DRAFT_17356 [Piptocephalis cylindrospora]|uniref:Uncharacterized protein n=1 Tax=Piptocephalis cylindrospora TaxID=1907219 RepID=A0A4P9Y031_9FUNG|nr:hypothetical protein BJ684DRAFT_17356 [Piptocephalis cylindrospora]|eukprot:RKP12128.1 hypothetical protein BJ684DRAFT_17356 [Piptocephalis cylindrospora]